MIDPELPESFYTFYSILASSKDIREPYLFSPLHKICIFCKRRYPETSFDLKPHLVPELLGRNKTITNHECDKCNQAFNFHETQLATFVQPFISILGIKTKNGIPVFQSRKGPDQNATTLRVEGNQRMFYLGTNLSDMVYDHDNKSVEIKFRSRPFIPFSIYKVVLKMVIALLPKEEREKNSHYFELLNAEEPPKTNLQNWTLYRFIMQGKMFESPSAKLFRADPLVVGTNEFPEFCLMLNFANVTLQFFAPISANNMENHKASNNLRFEIHPTFILDDYTRLKEIKMEMLDLNETNKITINEVMKMYYDRIEKDTQNE